MATSQNCRTSVCTWVGWRDIGEQIKLLPACEDTGPVLCGVHGSGVWKLLRLEYLGEANQIRQDLDCSSNLTSINSSVRGTPRSPLSFCSIPVPTRAMRKEPPGEIKGFHNFRGLAVKVFREHEPSLNPGHDLLSHLPPLDLSLMTVIASSVVSTFPSVIRAGVVWAIEEGGVRDPSSFSALPAVAEQCWLCVEGWRVTPCLFSGKVWRLE
ncbi:hypothetical protein H920_01666 [Fukomys damarensis]|uniref:Uncharacterized protein n=1 Tax=Fukomys damarensis TaxID=885580 RepID=A0A091DY19_FUKDA|nr:hypothetical protein H920_01666 [Fukomys damarensis]